MYSDDERAIFTYPVRGETVHADPDRIRRRFFKALEGEDLDGLMTKIKGVPGEDYETLEPMARATVDMLAFEAEETLLKAIHFAFETHPIDASGKGLTEREAFRAYRLWCEFMGALKKTDENLPISSDSLDPVDSL